MTVIVNDSGITFADGSVQPTALTTGTQTIAGAKTFSSNTTFSAGVQGALVLGTAQATTSGTSIDFTSIPSWVKRITVLFNGVSTNGTSNILIQVGAGSVSTSGYLGSGAIYINAGSPTIANYTAGFGIAGALAANLYHGSVVLSLVSSNVWAANGTLALSNQANTLLVAGSISLGGTLDRLRLTTVNGTDTFDAGSVNIMYEG